MKFWVNAFLCYPSYEGVLEGDPAVIDANERSRAIARAEMFGVPKVFIPTKPSPLSAGGGTNSLQYGCYICIARVCGPLLDDSDPWGTHSALALIWDECELPKDVAAKALVLVEGVDWKAHAVDYGS
jgi:hypothetical protein